MRRGLVFSLLLTLGTALHAEAAGDRTVDEVRPRVQYHLSQVEQLARQLETVLVAECPKFSTPEEWQAYFDGNVERVVSLVAHLEQAWLEAKQTADKEVRREAKAPRRRVDRARRLVAKVRTCADGNGASFTTDAVWQRIEREVPERQSEVALPPLAPVVPAAPLVPLQEGSSPAAP